MSKEIERKYLLMEDGIDYSTELFREVFISIDNLKKTIKTKGVKISQGYLDTSTAKERFDILHEKNLLNNNIDFKPKVLRLRNYGGKYLFTIKSSGKIEREEIEFKIPKKVFDKWWPETKGRRIEKIRYVHKYKSLKLEIDSFKDISLITLEIECSSIKEANKLPEFGKDVTSNSKYANSRLAR